MLPDIGIMIGCYILVRMISFLSRKENREEAKLVKVLAIICILVTLVCMADLLLSGAPK